VNNQTSLQTLAPEITPAQPPQTASGQEHALYSKIARFPVEVREQLNQRLHNGQSGSDILAWLNNLPSVKEILAAQFEGAAINGHNLTHWRRTGYHRWLRQKQNLIAIRELTSYAADVASAGGVARFAPAAAGIASGKIFEFLDAVDVENANPDELLKLTAAASALRKGEHDHDRVTLAKQRLRQHDLALVLQRDKQQRDKTAIGLRLLGDARAKQIEASAASYSEKIELLGSHMFGDFWEPRLLPESPAS